VFLRLLILASLFINLYACQGGFDSCRDKVKDAHAIVKNSLFIPVSNHSRLVYSRTTINEKEVLKHDPFLSLYEVADTKPFAYPFIINNKSQNKIAFVTQNKSCQTKLLQREIGLNTLGKISQTLVNPALLTSACCTLEGIVTPYGVIEKAYLQHFLQSKEKEIRYGDIGVRVAQNKHSVRVVAKDPFFQNNPLQKGDVIYRFDGEKISSAAYLMQKVLFCKVGSKHTVTYLREGKRYTTTLVADKRYGGGCISDTFLERKGLYFDKNLRLQKVGEHFRSYGLKRGDRLILVNGTRVKSQKELRSYIEKHHNIASLLFERNGFEFFVNIK